MGYKNGIIDDDFHLIEPQFKIGQKKSLYYNCNKDPFFKYFKTIIQTM
ncbi:hypothetical protein FLBR109950_10830 [Flavobacterium branchiophilum]